MRCVMLNVCIELLPLSLHLLLHAAATVAAAQELLHDLQCTSVARRGRAASSAAQQAFAQSRAVCEALAGASL
jgi:hypothetical protein